MIGGRIIAQFVICDKEEVVITVIEQHKKISNKLKKL